MRGVYGGLLFCGPAVLFLGVALCAVVPGHRGTVGRCSRVAWCWDTPPACWWPVVGLKKAKRNRPGFTRAVG